MTRKQIIANFRKANPTSGKRGFIPYVLAEEILEEKRIIPPRKFRKPKILPPKNFGFSDDAILVDELIKQSVRS